MTRCRAHRIGRQILLTAAGAGLLLFALAGPAFAHVTITPSSVTQGSTAELTFKVPNEEAKASVTELQLQVPTAYPIAQFLVRPVPGWTITVRTVTLAKPLVTDHGSFSTAVAEVTWTGGTILPGEYQDFSVSADPLPTDTSQLVFKAIQTYSNGDVVRWIDVPQAGQPAPEHPAPVLTLTSASSSITGAAPPGGGQDATALALGAAGLAAGLLGLAAGGSVWLRARQGGKERGGKDRGSKDRGGQHWVGK